MIVDVLHYFVDRLRNEWPSLTPMVEFAMKDLTSLLGHGITASYCTYADRAQHPGVLFQRLFLH
jgi:hypothetical protein